MNEDRRNCYLEILRVGILNIRNLAFMGMSKEIILKDVVQKIGDEADHIHDIPDLLKSTEYIKEDLYWSVQRTVYSKRADPIVLGKYQQVWSKMGPPICRTGDTSEINGDAAK